jgi:hypothetical protein
MTLFYRILLQRTKWLNYNEDLLRFFFQQYSKPLDFCLDKEWDEISFYRRYYIFHIYYAVYAERQQK